MTEQEAVRQIVTLLYDNVKRTKEEYREEIEKIRRDIEY